MLDEKTSIFELHRRTLEGIAYRMLGTIQESKDVVQDTYLKWSEVKLGELRSPRSWLITVCSRMALNQLQSARKQREIYVGEWLPEPFQDEQSPDPGAQAELDETVSVALMLALEKLTPAERAAFLLSDIFDLSFEEISAALGKTSAGCRQLASRARRRIRQDKPRFDSRPEEHQKLLEGFLRAAREGDVKEFSNLLVKDVEVYSDGGGKVAALSGVLRGADRAAPFFARVFQELRLKNVDIRAELLWFNGSPGLFIFEDETLATAISLEVREGRVHKLFAVRNPDKLAAFS